PAAGPVPCPELAPLRRLPAACSERDPAEIAAEIGAGGAAKLTAAVTDAANGRLRPIRTKRAELAAGPGHLASVLAAGNARANETADATLGEVREAMGMVYEV